MKNIFSGHYKNRRFLFNAIFLKIV